MLLHARSGTPSRDVTFERAVLVSGGLIHCLERGFVYGQMRTLHLREGLAMYTIRIIGVETIT
jgi:hypothetical protein